MTLPEPTPSEPALPVAAPVAGNSELIEELRLLREELVLINSHSVFSFKRIVGRALVMQFLKGTFLALGSIVGATIVISILVYFLSQIEVIPIVGEWIRELNEFLKEAKH